jgi:hypothetical protein
LTLFINFKKKNMKKLLLLSMVALGFTSNAQVIYSNDFTVGTGLTIIDADGDTSNWGLFTGDVTTASWGLTGNFAGSRSWNPATATPAGALTPNNFLQTPQIQLPLTFDTLSLSFKVGSSCPANATYYAEQISIYLAPASATTAAAISTLTPVFNLTLNEDYRRIAVQETVDISSYNGQNVRIVMRHHNCTDQELMFFDDLKIEQTALGTDSFFASNYAVGPNPASDVVNISAKNNNTINTVEITDINGRVVKNVTVNAATSQINVADLNSGVYFLKASSENGVGTSKIVKK